MVAPTLPAAEVIAPVIAWGSDRFGVGSVPESLVGVVSLSAGYDHALALREDGQVMAWGSNLDGERDVPSDLGSVVAVYAGDWISYALRQDGTLIGWGGRTDGGLVPVPDQIMDVVSVDFASGAHALVLKRDGTMVALGNNFAGQLDMPAGLSNVVQVSAGYGYSLALRADATVAAWGAKLPFPRPDVGHPVAIAAGRLRCYFLQPDGSIIHWGAPPPNAVETSPPITGAVAIAATESTLVALRRDGSLTAWPVSDSEGTAGRVPTLPNPATVLTARGDHALALVRNPSVQAPEIRISRTPSGVRLSFPSALGRTYRIESRATTPEGTWRILGIRPGTGEPIGIDAGEAADSHVVRVAVY